MAWDTKCFYYAWVTGLLNKYLQGMGDHYLHCCRIFIFNISNETNRVVVGKYVHLGMIAGKNWFLGNSKLSSLFKKNKNVGKWQRPFITEN